MMGDQDCPTHGRVLAVQGGCPWGCEHVFEPATRREPPGIVWELQRATEAITLFHLTEPKEQTA